MMLRPTHSISSQCLNESPSEKEGKSNRESFFADVHKGLNESPSEKEGKSARFTLSSEASQASMKVPPKRKGNSNKR